MTPLDFFYYLLAFAAGLAVNGFVTVCLIAFFYWLFAFQQRPR